MGYWQTKVLPKIKKVFEKNGTKKTAAAEACKSFDESKEEITKEFEEKKTELEPKVIEIYEASSAEIKTLVKEPKEAGLKKHSTKVHKFLEELVKIEFPGSKPVSEATSKYGAGLISGPICFIFEKVSSLIPVVEEKAVEEPAPAPEAETREIVVETEEKKEEVVAVPPPETSTEKPAEPPVVAAATAEPVVAAPAAAPTEPAKEEPAAAKP